MEDDRLQLRQGKLLKLAPWSPNECVGFACELAKVWEIAGIIARERNYRESSQKRDLDGRMKGFDVDGKSADKLSGVMEQCFHLTIRYVLRVLWHNARIDVEPDTKIGQCSTFLINRFDNLQ